MSISTHFGMLNIWYAGCKALRIVTSCLLKGVLIMLALGCHTTSPQNLTQAMPGLPLKKVFLTPWIPLRRWVVIVHVCIYFLVINFCFIESIWWLLLCLFARQSLFSRILQQWGSHVLDAVSTWAMFSEVRGSHCVNDAPAQVPPENSSG